MDGTDEVQFQERVRQVLLELSAEEQKLLKKVINAERSKIHMKNPYGINQLIIEAVKETIPQ